MTACIVVALADGTPRVLIDGRLVACDVGAVA
jgi:hypothetical protein